MYSLFEFDSNSKLLPKKDFNASDRDKLATLKMQWGKDCPTFFIRCNNLQSMPKNCEGSIVALTEVSQKGKTQDFSWNLNIVLHMDFNHTHVACVHHGKDHTLSFGQPRCLLSDSVYVIYLNQVSGKRTHFSVTIRCEGCCLCLSNNLSIQCPTCIVATSLFSSMKALSCTIHCFLYSMARLY